MPDSDKLESLIVADIGNVNTKIGLVDQVGGEFRFVGTGVSATTAEPPSLDVGVGVRRALEQLSLRTSRALLGDDGQLLVPERPGGQGVDGFAIVASAATPLQIAIVGLSREVSVTSASAAAHGTYATVVTTLALDESGGRWRRAPRAASDDPVADTPSTAAALQDPAVIAAEALAHANPEVIVLVGGVDGGATTPLYELANLVASVVAALDESRRPTVIFAGNREARPQIAARIGQVATLRMVDNIHPTLSRQNLDPLQRELEALYVERMTTRLPGVGALGQWSGVPIIPTARAFENVVRFLSRRYHLNVLGVDLGGTTTTILKAGGETYSRVVRADLGVGSSLTALIKQGGLEALTGWLPIEMPAETVLAHYMNQALRPASTPVTRSEARLQQAAARQALATAVREARLDTRALDLVVLSGGMFAYTTDYGALALLALDALQPRGVFTLAVDALGLAPAFGALAALNPDAAANVIERDAFVTLGTIIAPVSGNRDGQIDLRIEVQPAGGGAINLEVEHGSLEVIPLAPGQKAALQIRMAPGVDLGAERRGVFKAEVEGGAIGLIIDARGRPVTLPVLAEKRREKIQKWLWDVGS